VTEVVQGWAEGDPPTCAIRVPPDRASACDLPFSRTPTLDRFSRCAFVPAPGPRGESGCSGLHQTQYTQEERASSFPKFARLLNGIVYLQ
jgi:hypothetical protein